MPEPTMQELLLQMQQQIKDSEQYKSLLTALRNYNDKTANFRETRGRGKLPLVTDKDKTALMALHKAIRDAAEPVLGDENEPAAIRQAVRLVTKKGRLLKETGVLFCQGPFKAAASFR